MRTDVQGKIVMKTYLTGMPECKFGLNDKLFMDKESQSKLADSKKYVDTTQPHKQIYEFVKKMFCCRTHFKVYLD